MIHIKKQDFILNKLNGTLRFERGSIVHIIDRTTVLIAQIRRILFERFQEFMNNNDFSYKQILSVAIDGAPAPFDWESKFFVILLKQILKSFHYTA